MNPFTKQFHTHGNETRLTDAERARMHAALLTAMEMNAPIASPFFERFVFSRVMVAAVAILIVIGGSTAYAAEGSVPGDFLYSVKVGVNEPVVGAFAFSNTAKAKWHADVAEARLSEAEMLAARGELTASTSEALAENFNEHARAIALLSGDISVLDPNSGSDISSKFSSLVARHGAAILAAGKRSKNAIALRASGDLVVNVAGNESGGAGSREKTSAGASTSFAAPMLLTTNDSAAGELKTSMDAEALSLRAHVALADATSTLSTTILSTTDNADSAARVAAIENLVVKADAELSIGAVRDAARDFETALLELKAFDSMLKTNAESNGDGSESNDSEDGGEHESSIPNIF
jgi:hypothetical protein